ncbi:MAG: hypothetical protein IJD70_06950 [Clostridia bacterium]|nr:hypothetical protein [Clostridia bacterium]
MKKITAILVAVVLMLNMMAIMASADAAQVTDITNDIKYVTAYEMYANKMAIVRADAVFMGAYDYDTTLVAKAPGYGTRWVTFTDWAANGMESYFDDYFNLGDGYFGYDAVWAESGSDPYDHGRLSYKFTVEEAGMYELVIVGCAQIKPENVDNDAKDRGFAFQIDGGEIQQVNISDTLGTFQNPTYMYTYSKAELDSTLITTANGVNSYYYQPTYYYGIQVNLTAGEHIFDYYHLFYSGEHVFESGNGPRLNYMGAYVQKFLTDAERDNYVYPETTAAPETTEEPKPETTKAEETTAAPEKTDDATQAPTPEQTKAPTAGTEAPKEEKPGCGGMIGFATILALIPAAIVIKKKRD